jgi:hypothetical protein
LTHRRKSGGFPAPRFPRDFPRVSRLARADLSRPYAAGPFAPLAVPLSCRDPWKIKGPARCLAGPLGREKITGAD